MSAPWVGDEATEAQTAAEIPLGLGWSVSVAPRSRGAHLSLLHPHQAGVDVEITVTARGPVVRVTAAALEISALGEIAASCQSFRIDATEAVTIRGRAVHVVADAELEAQGHRVSVLATHGDVRLKANDDVQLLGEQVLLNCDREPPMMPSWVAAKPPSAILPREDSGGDPALLAASIESCASREPPAPKSDS